MLNAERPEPISSMRSASSVTKYIAGEEKENTHTYYKKYCGANIGGSRMGGNHFQTYATLCKLFGNVAKANRPLVTPAAKSKSPSSSPPSVIQSTAMGRI